MRATSGHNSTASSRSAALQSSLANRLQVRLASCGSPLYALTWKNWDMPWGAPICALRGSGRRTSGNDCTGWPTPKSGDADKGVRTMRGAEKELERKGPGSDLCTLANAAGWLTPSANEDAAGLPGSKMQVMLGSQVKLADLDGRDSGTPSNGSPAATGKPGQLNPAFTRWLQGYPPVWDDCAATATRLCPKSRRRSSKPTAA